jgi:2-methylcitrate dehydratase
MVAVPLVFGRLTADDYGDAIAADPRIDALREKMSVRENAGFTAAYFDPEKRYIGNSVQVFFKDGTATEKVSIDFPIGHRNRRAEGIPVLMAKFESAIRTRLPAAQMEQVLALVAQPKMLDALPITEFIALFRS